jgi:hypothetical protein
MVDNIWLPFYDGLFNESGYNFRKQHERLLNVCRMLMNSLEQGPRMLLLFSLSRYPFNIPEHPDLLLSSYQTVGKFDGLISYITQMAEEPIKRLEKLLTVVNSGVENDTIPV